MSLAPAAVAPAARPVHAARALAAGALAGILLVALLVRLHEARAGPLWFDEIFTLWTARAGASGVIDLLGRDVHPPLFFLMASGWRALVGEGDLWIRLLPIAAGVATVAAAYALGRDAFERRAGLLAALFLALLRGHVYFSQELRAFSLLWLLQTIAAWAALRWTRAPSVRDAALFVVAAAAALDTHYFAGLVLPVLGLWGVLATIRDRRRLLGWIGLQAAVAGLFLPQLPVFMHQLAIHRGDHWTCETTWADGLDAARQLSFGASYLIPLVAALALLPLFRREQRRAGSLMWLLIVLPTLATWGISLNGPHVFTPRFLLYAAPLSCALLAGGISGLRWRRTGLVAGLLLALFAARSVAKLGPLPEAGELQATAAWLLPRLRPGDTVVHAETHSLLFFRHYYPGRARHLLLLASPRLPYYEGAELIPAAWRIDTAEFRRVRGSGARWWAVRVRHSGNDGKELVPLLDLAAGSPARADTLVTVWAPPDASPPAR